MRYIFLIFLFPLTVFSQIITEDYALSGPCSGETTITYSGQTYQIIEIGSQCWFKENLNVGTAIPGATTQTDNSIIEKHCYADSPANCTIYGGLYEYWEAMNWTDEVSSQGICPTGWHIPISSEIETLAAFLGGTTVAGGKMKEAGTVHWSSPNTGATNESGFTALPGGLMVYSEFRGYFSENIYSYMWKIDWSDGYPQSLDLIYNFATLFTSGGRDVFDAVSVRCLKD